MPDGRTRSLKPHERMYVLAVLLLLIGLAVGFLPVLTSNDRECGSAFRAGTDETADLVDGLKVTYGLPPEEDDCDGVRSTARTIAYVALGAGLVLGAGGWITAANAQGRREE